MSTVVAFLQRVDDRARQLSPAAVVLAVLSAPFYALGWLVGHVVRALWLAVAWACVAVKLGFTDARGAKGGT